MTNLFTCDKCKKEWKDGFVEYCDLEDDGEMNARNLAIHQELIAKGLWKKECKKICKHCYHSDYFPIKSDYLAAQKLPQEKCSKCGRNQKVGESFTDKTCFHCKQEQWQGDLTCARCGKNSKQLYGSLELGIKGGHCNHCLDEIKQQRERERERAKSERPQSITQQVSSRRLSAVR